MPKTFPFVQKIANSKNAKTEPGKHADLKTGAAPKQSKGSK